MPIYIHNSLSRKKEEFIPIRNKQIKMYVCGPTVYDEPHIGHARSAYIFDVIRRYLIFRGNKVTFVRNVTDVDDKIIDKARNEFKGEPLNSSVVKVSQKYLQAYHDSMASLGIIPPDFEPKATEYIKEMQDFINGLIMRGVAYESLGDVYFDIKKAQGYGKLSNQALANMESGARVSPGENKRDPLDFALWKSAKKEEPFWDSPWGKGRPGWHIECSVMSSKLLGDEFDIHGGGLDLIFPHHENEVAQSEGAGKKFARYWIHNGLLTINSQKMSKSLGNFVTVNSFISRYKDPDLLKLFFLSAHYSHPVDYTEGKIEEARQAKERLLIFFDKVSMVKGKFGIFRIKFPELDKIKNRFLESMNDDFNTPAGLACIFELITLGNKNIDNPKFILKAKEILNEFLKVFNIELKKISTNAGISDDEILAKIDERLKARVAKDFSLSDKIRNELEEKGIILEDTRDGKTNWRRKL